MTKKLQSALNQYRPFLIVIGIGVLLLLIPTSCENNADSKTNGDELQFSVKEFQKEIEYVLESGEGVGRVEVMLTLKSTAESVYAEEARITQRQQGDGENADYDSDSDRKPSVISDGTGKEVPVMVKQMYPEFLGATVVCDGAENVKVRVFITDAISALTGITTDRIAIIKMKQ